MGEAVEVLLEIRGLHKSFEDRKVLQQINLDVTKGEVVVVLGPSGCGKSTLLRCLNGLEPVQSGDIRYRGQDLTDKKVNWRGGAAAYRNGVPELRIVSAYDGLRKYIARPA